MTCIALAQGVQLVVHLGTQCNPDSGARAADMLGQDEEIQFTDLGKGSPIPFTVLGKSHGTHAKSSSTHERY